MSTEVMLRSNAALDDKVEYCRLLADSGLLPAQYRKQPANVLYAVEYGEMIGVPAMAAINGVHVIKGKPTASSSLISALVRRAGHKLRVGFDSARQMGWAEIIRADDPDFTYRSEWDLERAVTAELCVIRDGKPYAVDKDGDTLPWKKFFPSMTKARAITEVARDACEEVLFGLHYTPEELGAQVDEDGMPTLTVEQAVDKMRRNKGQQPDDDWTSEPGAQPQDAEPKPSTNAQRTKLVLLVKDKRGVTDDGQRRVILGHLVGREIASSKELTLAEAHKAIDALEAEPDHIADAEVVEPIGTEPNPRNGDTGKPLDPAAFVPSLQSLLTDSRGEGGPTVAGSLDGLIAKATTAPELAAIWRVADEAHKGGHLTGDEFANLNLLGQAKDRELSAAAAIERSSDAPTDAQYEAADSLKARIQRAGSPDALNDLHGTLTEARDGGTITPVQFASLEALAEARYPALAKAAGFAPDPANEGWSHQRLAQMAGSQS